MTTYLFDKLTDTANYNATPYDPAYGFFVMSPEEAGFEAQSISPSGDYVGGGALFTDNGNTKWVVKTTPLGSPTLIMKAVFDGIEWTGNDANFRDIDMQSHCIDDEGFTWGTSGFWGTNLVLPQSQRHRGVVGYIDPNNPSIITKAFSWTDNPNADADDFNITRLCSFTMPDASIRIIALPAGENPLIFDYDKSAETLTTHTTDETWIPKFLFQDGNGDLWACGIPTISDGTLKFLRFTDVTGTSAYPASQSFSIPGFGPNPEGDPRGYFAGGFFIGGWAVDANADIGSACGTLFKLNLTTSAVTSTADVTADPLLLFRYPSNPNPTFYFVQKANDPERAFNVRGACRIFYKLTTSLTLTTTYDLDTWVAGDFGNDAGSEADDVYTMYWSDGRQAFMGLRYQWMLEDGSIDADRERLVTDLFIYYFGAGAGGDGDADTDESLTLRVWGYNLDNHDNYVLRVGPSASLVYDLTTGQWAEWASPGRDNWRAHIGCNWLGMTGTLADGATDVVAGDDVTGILWRLDPLAGVDDNPTTGTIPFTRMVIGGVPLDGREVSPCNAVTLSLSLGNPALIGATITLRTSDDQCHSYVNHGSVITSAGVYDQCVEWRALGLMRAPGRVFEISDNGAAVRLNAADLR